MPGCCLRVSARPSILLLPLIYLGFISLGLPDGTLGVAWPRMHTDLDLPIGLAGTLLLVVTLLSAIASFSSATIIARFQTGPVVLVSCVLTGTGLLLVAHAQDLRWLMLAGLPLGFGAGAVDAGLNGYVARHYDGRHMNWLHACWGVGATGGPLVLAGALAGETGWRGGYLTLALVQLSLAGVFGLTLGIWRSVPDRPRKDATMDHPATRAPTTSANSEAGWLSAVIFILYVAIEGTAGLWAGSILVVARHASLETAGWCTAGYYGAITAGRILVGFVVERWGNRRLIAVGLGLALSGAALFTIARTTGVAAGALVLLGLGLAPMYPCLMHEVPRRFAPDAVQVVIGRQSGAAYLGGAFLPAAAGWLANRGSLETVAATLVAGVLILSLALRRLNRIT